jgi:hypothetical protein
MNHFGFYLIISIGVLFGFMATLILFGFRRHVKKLSRDTAYSHMTLLEHPETIYHMTRLQHPEGTYPKQPLSYSSGLTKDD